MLNKVQLIGNVGHEPKIIKSNNTTIATFSLATTRRGYTDKNGNKVAGVTDWHSVVVFNRLAEVVGKYITKGSKLYVEGELRYRTYSDKNGVEKQITEIVAENIEMLGGNNPQQNTQSSEVNNVPNKGEEDLPWFD